MRNRRRRRRRTIPNKRISLIFNSIIRLKIITFIAAACDQSNALVSFCHSDPSCIEVTSNGTNSFQIGDQCIFSRHRRSADARHGLWWPWVEYRWNKLPWIIAMRFWIWRLRQTNRNVQGQFLVSIQRHCESVICRLAPLNKFKTKHNIDALKRMKLILKHSTLNHSDQKRFFLNFSFKKNGQSQWNKH